ncbi:hypothetical protein ACTXT7_006468 [Hymenolepis weldensis]
MENKITNNAILHHSEEKASSKTSLRIDSAPGAHQVPPFEDDVAKDASQTHFDAQGDLWNAGRDLFAFHKARFLLVNRFWVQICVYAYLMSRNFQVFIMGKRLNKKNSKRVQKRLSENYRY